MAKYMEADEYQQIDNQNLFQYKFGDTIQFIKNGLYGCGHVQDRRSAYVGGIVDIFYVVNDLCSSTILVEEDDIIQNDSILLIEALKIHKIGPGDYEKNIREFGD